MGTSHSSIGVANDYLHRVGPLIREHDGFIDKYIGDAIMGLFPGKADDALNAAIALQREIRVFNLHCEKDGKPTIAAGVGIHTGDLMLGTIGERGRMETTVIADAVNAASRLETATKTFAAPFCSAVKRRTLWRSQIGSRYDDLGCFKLKASARNWRPSNATTAIPRT
ncbi:MAG: adenylate/guanylate cyclase domain-containing protein [Candidatus Cybelea sp.]